MTIHRQELANRGKAAFAELHNVIEKALEIEGLTPKERGGVKALGKIIDAAHKKANRIIGENDEISPFFGGK